MPPALLHLSGLLGVPVRGVNGQTEAEGRLVDVVARLAGGNSSPAWHPAVAGLVVEVGGTERFAHSDGIDSLSYSGIQLAVTVTGLGEFQRRPGEVLLGRDVRSRHLIDIKSARLVRANEIELAQAGGRWHVQGVDTSSLPVVRRALPRRLRKRVKLGRLVDWSDVEPFVGHVPTARLQVPFAKLRRLHPAELADLVEAASHEEGEEIIRAVGADSELEADVFEELSIEHQVELLRNRTDGEAARLLSLMASDDAVDLLCELDQDRRLQVLQLLPAGTQDKMRSLLGYNARTAGGLMSPELVTVTSTSSVVEALEAVKASAVPAEAAAVVFVTDEEGRLEGTALAVALLRAKPSDSVMVATRLHPTCLSPGADVHEVVRKMSDFNLLVAPVVAEDGRLLGQVTVDDVLELMLPSGWRRQYGMASAE